MLEDWVEWTAYTGTKYITYDAEITTAEQAEAKGYTGVTQVFSSGIGKSERTGDVLYNFQENGKVTDGSGSNVDISDVGHVATNGTRINKALSGVEQVATGLQLGGDAITAIGLITLQPEIVAVGETLSKIGRGVEVINNFATEGVNKETMINSTVKVGLSVGFGELGKAGIKATRGVAGEVAVKAGANIVSESIIQGTTTLGNKVADKMAQEMIKKKK